MCLELQPGSRCLLIGANGAGKTTLLKILAGKHMVSREQVRLQQGANSQQLKECCSAASVFEASSSFLVSGSLVCMFFNWRGCDAVRFWSCCSLSGWLPRLGRDVLMTGGPPTGHQNVQPPSHAYSLCDVCVCCRCWCLGGHPSMTLS
jgi:energy-coupling factor transporter ATP-binding protein EcfA2